MSKFIDRLLQRYEQSGFVIKNRARFILYLILTLLAISPVLIIYHLFIHSYSLAYNFRIQMSVVGPEIAAFVIFFLILIILIKGHFSIAGNLLIITCQSTIWGIMFFSHTDLLTRTDTIALITATLAMMPIIVVGKAVFTEFLREDQKMSDDLEET